MKVTLIGFNTYKTKEGQDRAEVHLITDLPLKQGSQVMIARIPYDPFQNLIVGSEYEAIVSVYTYNGELKSKIIGLR